MLLVALLTCCLVDSLTFLKKIGVNWILMDLIGVKFPITSGVMGGCFMYLIPSTQSVNYERVCVFLLRFRLMMA